MGNVDEGVLFIGGILTAIVIVLIAQIVATAHEDYLIAEAIAKGADPIEANCAIRGINSSNAAICTIKAVNHGK